MRLNKNDLDEAPEAAKIGMEFIFVDRIDEVIKAALADLKP
jgi:ATP-dependent Lon protease